MVKQVIVMRKDLKVRRGKECSQAAHASISWLAKRVVAGHPIAFSRLEMEWLTGPFTKICLQVDSEAELRAVYDAAVKADIEAHLIVDNGQTEFNGVPTPTCCAIGPNADTDIDAITGYLKLY